MPRCRGQPANGRCRSSPYRSRYRVLSSFQHHCSHRPRIKWPPTQAQNGRVPKQLWLLEYVRNGNSVRTAIALNQSRIERWYRDTSRYGRNVAGQETAMVTERMCSDVQPKPGEILPPVVPIIEQASNPLQLESGHFVSDQDSPHNLAPARGCLQQTRRLTSAA